MAKSQVSREMVPEKLRFQTLRVWFALIMREMATTYGRSPGGYLWAILEPAAGIALLTIAFSFFLRSPPLGSSFALFYATGLMPFLVYSDLSAKVAQTIRFSRPLLVYPRVTFLDAIIARFLLNLMTQILVYYIVIVGIILLFDLSVTLDYIAISKSLGLAALLGLSIGSVNSLLFSFFPVWERIWAIVNRPLLLASCIFYVFEGIPEAIQAFLWYNPLIHIIGLTREGIYPEYSALYFSAPYVLLCCIVPLTFGVHFLRVYHKKILNEL